MLFCVELEKIDFPLVSSLLQSSLAIAQNAASFSVFSLIELFTIHQRFLQLFAIVENNLLKELYEIKVYKYNGNNFKSAETVKKRFNIKKICLQYLVVETRNIFLEQFYSCLDIFFVCVKLPQVLVKLQGCLLLDLCITILDYETDLFLDMDLKLSLKKILRTKRKGISVSAGINFCRIVITTKLGKCTGELFARAKYFCPQS